MTNLFRGQKCNLHVLFFERIYIPDICTNFTYYI